MKTTRAGFLVGALLLALAAGCQPIPPAVTPSVPPTTTPAAQRPVATATLEITPTPVEGTPMNETLSPTPAYEPAMEPLVQAAVADLAQRLGVTPGEIGVIEAGAIVWPDASIGCPQPDMMYIQVPQDGALIRLSAGGKTYNYHYGGRRGLFLCEQPSKPGATPAPEEMQLPGGGGEDL
jgi:hypothetical protein